MSKTRIVIIKSTLFENNVLTPGKRFSLEDRLAKALIESGKARLEGDVPKKVAGPSGDPPAAKN